jgi:hypothetical protein
MLRLERWRFFSSLDAEGSTTIWNLAKFMFEFFPAYNLMLSKPGPRVSDAFVEPGRFGKTGPFQKKFIFIHRDKHHRLLNWYRMYVDSGFIVFTSYLVWKESIASQKNYVN